MEELKINTIEDIKLDKSIGNELMEKYSYNPDLTKKLDNFKKDFDFKTVYEVILWKLNRFPKIEISLIYELNELRACDIILDKEKAEKVLKELLNIKGIGLPIASTILRFINPNQFQIIDTRAYRFLTGKYFSEKISIDKKSNLYFKYLNLLHVIANEENIEFFKMDRILYQADIEYNENIGLNGKVKKKRKKKVSE